MAYLREQNGQSIEDSDLYITIEPVAQDPDQRSGNVEDGSLESVRRRALDELTDAVRSLLLLVRTSV